MKTLVETCSITVEICNKMIVIQFHCYIKKISLFLAQNTLVQIYGQGGIILNAQETYKVHPSHKLGQRIYRQYILTRPTVLSVSFPSILSIKLYAHVTFIVSHQYFHYDSCHAEHIKRSIIFSQTLRLKRICSQKSDLDSHVKELKN